MRSLVERGHSGHLVVSAGGILDFTPVSILTVSSYILIRYLKPIFLKHFLQLVCCIAGFVIFSIDRMENMQVYRFASQVLEMNRSSNENNPISWTSISRVCEWPKDQFVQLQFIRPRFLKANTGLLFSFPFPGEISFQRKSSPYRPRWVIWEMKHWLAFVIIQV